MLLVTDGRNCFDSVLFYGNETTLVTFELLLFCLVDIYCHNYLTAGLTVFIIFKVTICLYKFFTAISLKCIFKYRHFSSFDIVLGGAIWRKKP